MREIDISSTSPTCATETWMTLFHVKKIDKLYKKYYGTEPVK